MRAEVFGSTFNARDAYAATRMPAIPNQGTFSRADMRSVERELPPYASATTARIDRGLRASGFTDFDGAPGILPRAIHSLNNRQQPSNAGEAVARQQGMNAVMHAFRGVAGLNGAGCTSTGGQVAQGVLAASGGILSSIGGGMVTTQPTATTSVTTTPIPNTSTASGTNKTATALTAVGAGLQLVGAIYTGVCTAQTGTTPPAVTTASQISQTTTAMINDIRTARASGGAAVDPAVAAAQAAAANPNNAQGAVPAPARDNTMLYVGLGIGAAALLGAVMVLRK